MYRVAHLKLEILITPSDISTFYFRIQTRVLHPLRVAVYREMVFLSFIFCLKISNFSLLGSTKSNFTAVSVMKPKKMTIWAALCKNGIIGSYFIEGIAKGGNCTQLRQNDIFWRQ